MQYWPGPFLEPGPTRTCCEEARLSSAFPLSFPTSYFANPFRDGFGDPHKPGWFLLHDDGWFATRIRSRPYCGPRLEPPC
jgi:hypothetical protein